MSSQYEYETHAKENINAQVDRKWLCKLMQKYHEGLSREDQQKRDALNAKYPILKEKAFVVAPMVEQSDLPFRLLCRRYGANLCYTPMIHARYFVKKQSYRNKMFRFTDDSAKTNKLDRPLIAQLCGNNKDVLLEAAKILQHHVDAVDINCGCPTKTAKRGGFGAYLLESRDYLVGIVKYLVDNLSVPVTVKVRLLPQGIDQSLELYRKLVDAGASLLTVHGRTKLNKGENISRTDWNAIRKVAECVGVGDRIPIIANGSISNLDDVRECIAYTGVDGVMSSEAILEYPALYSETQTAAVGYRRTGPARLEIAREYLNLCKDFPPEKGGGGTRYQCIKMHLQVFCYMDWKDDPSLRDSLFHAPDLEHIHDILKQVETIQASKCHNVENERLSWYMRHRTDKKMLN